MRHADFFSGAVSGFSLAASYVWGPEHELVSLCEIDPWRRKQLNRLWPGVPVIEDVNDEQTIANLASFRLGEGWPESEGQCGKSGASECGCKLPYADSDQFDRNASGYGSSQICREWKEPAGLQKCRIDLLTASPPCQPSSCAGLRLGTKDPRWLWPQTLRAVEITKPRWIIFENPSGFLSIDGGLAYESVCADLEGKGYWVESFIIPASAVGAWHRRDRVWIIASQDIGRSGREQGRSSEPRQESGEALTCDGDRAFANSLRHSGRSDESQRGPEGRTVVAGDNSPSFSSNNSSERCENGGGMYAEIYRSEARNGENQNIGDDCRPGDFREEFAASIGDPWACHWLQAVGELCPLVHGLPVKDSGKWIAALGDSVVPQVIVILMQAIKEAMNC